MLKLHNWNFTFFYVGVKVSTNIERTLVWKSLRTECSVYHVSLDLREGTWGGGENYLIKEFIILPTNQIKKEVVSEACVTQYAI